MEELIPLNPNNETNPVSARDLHAFLESKKDFSDWIKAKIEKYDFQEDKDFTTVQGKSNGGRPSIEYAITIPMAKELSMLESNKKGKMARQYFINCEENSKKSFAPITTADMFMLQARVNKEYEVRMDRIESKIDQLIQEKEDAGKEILLLERSTEQMPEETLRAKILRIINQYQKATLKTYQDIWYLVYDRLYYRYKIAIKKYTKKKGESNLDVAERNEFLDKIFVIVSQELVI